jgi:hypothetical protein
MKQLAESARSCGTSCGVMIWLMAVWFFAEEISPIGRNQRSCAIGEDQHQMEDGTPMRPAEYRQGLALEWVVRTDDRYAFRVTVQVVVGSVSCLPSMPSTTSGW